MSPRNFVDTNNKKEASAAAQNAVGLTAAPGIHYAFSLPITPELWDAAHMVGQARLHIKKIRGRADHEARGADDERIDTEGALAEILAGFVFDHVGAEIAPLVAIKPDSEGLDITHGDMSLDAKSVGQGRDSICINQHAHNRKAADAYLLVHLVRDDVADVYVASHATVSSWYLATTIKGRPLDPRRYFYISKLPKGLEALPAKDEAEVV